MSIINKDDIIFGSVGVGAPGLISKEAIKEYTDYIDSQREKRLAEKVTLPKSLIKIIRRGSIDK